MANLNVTANETLLKQIGSSWQPKLDFWSTLYARGSGIDYEGERKPLEGWIFSRLNNGMGVQIAFPLLDGRNLKVKKQQQNALLEESRKKLELLHLSLKRQEQVVRNYLKSALLISGETPIEFEVASANYLSLNSRYQAGLIDNVQLIQSQYDLLNAEVKLKSSKIVTWKALLGVAAIAGDINIFLNQIEN
ncbi:MAG: hypothetical protein IPL46_14665 [Saprospiraceae bacterium]|nr:hypothetical protein [Saprospiraceae bacterium]